MKKFKTEKFKKVYVGFFDTSWGIEEFIGNAIALVPEEITNTNDVDEVCDWLEKSGQDLPYYYDRAHMHVLEEIQMNIGRGILYDRIQVEGLAEMLVPAGNLYQLEDLTFDINHNGNSWILFSYSDTPKLKGYLSVRFDNGAKLKHSEPYRWTLIEPLKFEKVSDGEYRTKIDGGKATFLMADTANFFDKKFNITSVTSENVTFQEGEDGNVSFYIFNDE